MDKTKRPRPVLSCIPCRTRKLKCNRASPCEQCTKAGRAEECNFANSTDGAQSYEANQPANHVSNELISRKRARQESEIEGIIPHDENSSSGSKVGVIEDLQLRVKALEDAVLSKSSMHDSRALNQGSLSEPKPSKYLGVLDVDGSRFRYRGQIHRATFLQQFDDVRAFISRAYQEPYILSMFEDIQRLYKSNLRKHHVHVPQPVANAHMAVSRMIEMLPPRQTCDILVNVYLQHWEKTLRIIHVPTFLRQCIIFWEDRAQQTLPPGFVSQLLAIIIIASQVYDTEGALSPHFAEDGCDLLKNWQDCSSGKQRNELSVLQAATLRVLARQVLLISMDKLWPETGSLLRHAMTMGLHRDPSESGKLSVFQGELRRRLWATILEMDVQCSLMYSMPAAISPLDFSCKAPSNIHDNKLSEQVTELSDILPRNVWTDTLSQSVLYESVRLRLRAVQLLSSQSLEAQQTEVAQIGFQLEQQLSHLPDVLTVKVKPTNVATVPDRYWGLMLLDIYIRRGIVSLYRPLALMLCWSEAKDFRRACLQFSYKILLYQESLDPNYTDLQILEIKPYWTLFQNIFKPDVLQAAYCLCLEIKAMTEASSGSGSASPTVSLNAQRKLPVHFTKPALTHQVKSTLESLIQAIPASDIKDILILAIVLQSVRLKASKEENEAGMMEELVNMINISKQRLQNWAGSQIGSESQSTEPYIPEQSVLPNDTASNPALQFDNTAEIQDFNGLDGTGFDFFYDYDSLSTWL